MANNTLINGLLTEEISFLDRGLHYGDGLFETIAVEDGSLLCMNEHIQRLEHGCNVLKISFPQRQLIEDEAKSLIKNINRGVIKIIVTRGQGGRGYALPDNAESSRVISLYPWPEYPPENYSDGIILRVCNHRYGQNSILAGIKHLNRLEQVLARAEWDDKDIAEGLVLDQEDNVIEGTMSNVFYFSNNKLYTPDLSVCGVNGIIRDKILELTSELNIKTEVNKATLQSLMNADEVFICNSIIGLWSVKKINDKLFPIGKKTKQLQLALQEHHYIASC